MLAEPTLTFIHAFIVMPLTEALTTNTSTYRKIYHRISPYVLTHSPIQHFETVPNSKKLQTTTEIWLLKDFKIQIT